MSRTLLKGFVALVSFVCYSSAYGQSRFPSIQLQAYERITLSGVAPSAVVKVGGEEIPPSHLPLQSDYYIYLITRKVPNLQLDQVWMKQELYNAALLRVTTKQVLLPGNGKQIDTLVKFTNEAIWQVIIKDKDVTGSQPKRDMKAKVANNQLVIKLKDKNGTIYYRTIKNITQLNPLAGE